MSTKPRKTKPKTPQQRMQARRALARSGFASRAALGALRDPKVRADLQRQGARLASHPENAAIDDWIETIVDWSEWR
jgi:hypothetical protein